MDAEGTCSLAEYVKGTWLLLAGGDEEQLMAGRSRVYSPNPGTDMPGKWLNTKSLPALVIPYTIAISEGRGREGRWRETVADLNQNFQPHL